MKMASVGLSIFKAALLMFFISDADAAHIGDPEPEVTWTPPADVENFKNYAVGARYTGLLWAGRNEFPWLVDVRTADDDQENWSVGNLVTYRHVLTSCRAVGILQSESKEVYGRGSDVRVFYCQDYLWADHVVDRHNTDFPEDRDFSLTGWRAPKKIIHHESCLKSDYLLLFDAAVIVMNRGIPPIPPRLGYMPTVYDWASDGVKEIVKLDSKQSVTYKSPICYVASFGRHSLNNNEYYTLDYKIKYRVYITPWKDCQDRWEYICPPPSTDCKTPEKYVEALPHAPMCLRPRAKVGTVCDHDRGAPLVCNGQVIGLVIRAAEFGHCNNLYKIPFVAEKIANYRTFLGSVYYAVQPVPMKTDPPDAPGRTTDLSPFSGTRAHVVGTNPVLQIAFGVGAVYSLD